ncbi:hypothetical protein GCM10009608_76770 [Pseudonocardia alaniniphila]
MHREPWARSYVVGRCGAWLRRRGHPRAAHNATAATPTNPYNLAISSGGPGCATYSVALLDAYYSLVMKERPEEVLGGAKGALDDRTGTERPDA